MVQRVEALATIVGPRKKTCTEDCYREAQEEASKGSRGSSPLLLVCSLVPAPSIRTYICFAFVRSSSSSRGPRRCCFSAHPRARFVRPCGPCHLQKPPVRGHAPLRTAQPSTWRRARCPPSAAAAAARAAATASPACIHWFTGSHAGEAPQHFARQRRRPGGGVDERQVVRGFAPQVVGARRAWRGPRKKRN